MGSFKLEDYYIRLHILFVRFLVWWCAVSGLKKGWETPVYFT